MFSEGDLCPQGYSGLIPNCNDVDECSFAYLNECGYNAKCINKMGGYNCECNDGFYGNGLSCLSKFDILKRLIRFFN